MTDSARILIVDDKVANRNVLNDLVIALGHTSILAENGLSALDQMAKQPPDLVLLDILMPVMDGYEVLNRIKSGSDLRHVPVIMISAVDEMESVVRCIERGADDYLTKPVNSTLLNARIGACLEKKHLHDAERELLENTLNGSIKVLMDILAIVNPTAFSRASRLKRIVRHIARECMLSDTWQFELAAMLSQIGCLILLPDLLEGIYAGHDLSKEEYEMFASHPSIGSELMAKIPRLEQVSRMIAGQQKPLNNNQGKKEPRHREPIELGGQILKVAIAYDSHIFTGMSHKMAVEKLLSNINEYDHALVTTLYNLQDSSIETVSKTITVDKLQPGMILDEDLRIGGVLLLTKGQEVSYPITIRLRLLARLRLLTRLRDPAHSKEIVIPIRVLAPR